MQAPIASLSLILTLAVTIAPTPQGTSVRLATEYTGHCGYRTVNITLASDGSLTLDGKPIARTHLARELHEKYRTRETHWVFLQADPAATFQDVATLIAIAKTEAHQVALMPSDAGTQCWTIGYPPETIAEPKPPVIEPRPVPLWPWQ